MEFIHLMCADTDSDCENGNSTSLYESDDSYESSFIDDRSSSCTDSFIDDRSSASTDDNDDNRCVEDEIVHRKVRRWLESDSDVVCIFSLMIFFLLLYVHVYM